MSRITVLYLKGRKIMRNLTATSSKSASTPMERLKARKQRKPIKSTFSPEKARPIAERKAKELLEKQQLHQGPQTDQFTSTSSSSVPHETTLTTRNTKDSHLAKPYTFSEITEALMLNMQRKAERRNTARTRGIQEGMETMFIGGGGSHSPSIQSASTSGSSGARTPDSFVDIETLMKTMHTRSASPSIQSVNTAPSRTSGNLHTGELGSPFLSVSVSKVPSQAHSPFNKSAKLLADS